MSAQLAIALPEVAPAGATFSPDGRYRYTLRRAWSTRPLVAFVGLNPSTADASEDDPTIRRCVRFARDWGFGALAMVNLFAWRSTDPAVLDLVDDPVGPANDAVLAAVCQQAAVVVGAWGAHPLAAPRAADLTDRGVLGRWAALGWTKSGQPRHPLYMPAAAVPDWGPQATTNEEGRTDG